MRSLSPNTKRLNAAGSRLAWAPLTLDRPKRDVVNAAIHEACAFKEWPVLAVNVRTNHVHLVVVAPLVHPDRVMSTIKARATLRLREAGLVESDATVWTEHGSTRWLWSEPAVEAVRRYVLDEQGPDLT